ncbi:MAG: 3-dehydroquinate synthase [bacterium]
MKKIIIKLENSRYPVIISSDMRAFAKTVASYKLSKIAVITNKNIAKHHLRSLLSVLKKESIRCDVLHVPDGEKYKNIKTVEDICSALLKLKFDRKSGLISFGGGVIGDLCGFAASTFMRGIRFFQLPTTLLAQVDASIGGKTGVNLKQGKNMVGTFYQPELVWSNTEFLNTLPSKEWLNGFAEVVKYGVIIKKDYFEFLEKNLKLKMNKKIIDHIVYVSSLCKADVVMRDEKEIKGIREILNFGHTFGHLLESYFGYRVVQHGEAVSLGMVFACYIARKKGIFSETNRLINLLRRVNLPVVLPKRLVGSRWQEIMYSDKKFQNGIAKFVLPERIGKVRIVSGISKAALQNIINKMNADI